jgi:hypothetical protein
MFAEWLDRAHPEVSTLAELTRAHLEAFLVFDDHRAWRGRLARETPISVRHVFRDHCHVRWHQTRTPH